MNKKYILAATAAAMVLTIASAGAATLRDRHAGPRTLSHAAPRALGSDMAKTDSKLISITRTPLGATRSDYTPAPEKVLRSEDFSSELFSTGDIGKPDLDVMLVDPDFESFPHPAWFNLRPEAFGDGEIWGGHNLYPAGGCACLFNKKSYEIYEANIVVPVVDASAPGYEGIVYFEFIARVEDKVTEPAYIMVEGVETNDMGPTWNNLGTGVCEVTNQWMKYTAAFYGGGSSVILNIYNASGASVYVDDIVVYQQGQPCQTPIATAYTDYTGNSFTCHWEEAAGAESYLLDVYKVDKEYNQQGQVTSATTTYLLQDQPVNETYYNVTTAEPGVKYYYRVRSVKGDYVSLPSNEIEVNELLPTTMNPVTDFGEGGKSSYTASWLPIAGAEVYNYWARFENYAQEDGEFIVAQEDFTGMMTGDDEPASWTKEEPETYCYSSFYLRPLRQPGWRVANGMPYKDYVCLDAWQYIYGNGDAGLLSPQLDLSKDGGKFTVTIDMAANMFKGVNEETGQVVQGYPRGCAVVFNFDDEKGDYRQDELFYANDVNFNWATKTFNFTTGTEKSVIGIYAVYAPENLYLDNLKVVQNYKKGEMLLDPMYFGQYLRDTQVEVPLPPRSLGQKVYHQVCGVKSEIVEDSLMGEIGFLMSPYTPMQLVEGSDDWTAVKTPTLSAATVQPMGPDTILINNPEGETVTVYDLNGRVLLSNVGVQSQSVMLSGSGLYLVKVGNHTVKVHK